MTWYKCLTYLPQLSCPAPDVWTCADLTRGMPRLLVVTVRRTSLCRQNNCSTIAESLNNVQLKKKNTYTTVVLAQSEWCYWTALRESFVVERGIAASELLLQFCVFLLPHWYKPIQLQLKIYCTSFPKILISFYICTILSTFITLIMVQIFIENALEIAQLKGLFTLAIFSSEKRAIFN